MCGKYELKRGGYMGVSVWYFVLKSDEGKVLATSELFSSRENALKEIVAVRSNASTFKVNDLTESVFKI